MPRCHRGHVQAELGDATLRYELGEVSTAYELGQDAQEPYQPTELCVRWEQALEVLPNAPRQLVCQGVHCVVGLDHASCSPGFAGQQRVGGSSKCLAY